MRSLATYCLPALIAVVFSFSAGDSRAQEIITEQPANEEDIERVRIWLGLERKMACRVTVTISNSRGEVVRHYLNAMLGSGYYNFYWDKKDDSGRWVAPGKYSYLAQDCSGHNYGKLEVVYKEWERQSNVTVDEKGRNRSIHLELLADSARVTCTFIDRFGEIAARPIVDSLMDAGQHAFQPDSTTGLRPGSYTMELLVGDFLHRAEFRYKP